MKNSNLIFLILLTLGCITGVKSQTINYGVATEYQGFSARTATDIAADGTTYYLTTGLQYFMSAQHVTRILKVDPDGNDTVLFSYATGSSYHQCYDIQVVDTSIYFVGSFSSTISFAGTNYFFSGGQRAFLFVLSVNGHEQRVAEVDQLQGIATVPITLSVTNNHTAYVGGVRYAATQVSYVAKLGMSSATPDWINFLESDYGTGNDRRTWVYDLIGDDNQVAVAGAYSGHPLFLEDTNIHVFGTNGFVLEYSSNGALNWSHGLISDLGGSNLTGVERTHDGDIVVMGDATGTATYNGISVTASSTARNPLIMKLDADDGDLIQQSILSSTGNAIAYRLDADPCSETFFVSFRLTDSLMINGVYYESFYGPDPKSIFTRMDEDLNHLYVYEFNEMQAPSLTSSVSCGPDGIVSMAVTTYNGYFSFPDTTFLLTQGNHHAAVRLQFTEVPYDITPGSSSIEENQPVGSYVCSLSASDCDADEAFTFSLVDGVGADNNAEFQFAGSDLVTNAVFDYEAASTKTVRVRCTDAGGLSSESILNINIINVDDSANGIAAAPIAMVRTYPNPVIDQLLIASDDQLPLSVRVWSVTGQLVYEGSTRVIPCANWSPGIYEVECRATDGRLVLQSKVVKAD